MNHLISRRLADFAKDAGLSACGHAQASNPAIAVEALGGIRKGRRLQQRTDSEPMGFL
jgi:hypothetical protein